MITLEGMKIDPLSIFIKKYCLNVRKFIIPFEKSLNDESPTFQLSFRFLAVWTGLPYRPLTHCLSMN